MTQEELKDTKCKIMFAARALFAEKGFEGASVRDIASSAQVNIAALNYHFTSKENLYQQVIKEIFLETSSKISEHYKHNPNQKVSDLAIWIFRYFLEKEDVLRSTFKMFLSNHNSEENTCDKGEDQFGPPGGMVLAVAVQKEVGRKVSEPDLFWSVKMIFTSVVHLSLMYSNHFCKLEHEMTYHTKEVLEADIRRLVKVVLKDL